MSSQFYNQNQNRKYPFHDGASLMDDDGKFLPDGLIVDLSITIDSTYGENVYVSAISIVGGVVTVILSAVSTKLPLALARLDTGNQLLFLNYRRTSQIQLTPLVDGVSGTIILGEALASTEAATYAFSEQAATISPRCVFSLAVPGGQKLGVYQAGYDWGGGISLSSAGDIEIAFESRELGGRTVQAVVFRLKGTSQTLASYAASLQRPEARSCVDPQPIETINNVQPDCCGRIFIEFRGCATPTPIVNHCGVVLECALTLIDICGARNDFSDIPQIDLCSSDGNIAINPSDNQPDAPT